MDVVTCRVPQAKDRVQRLPAGVSSTPPGMADPDVEALRSALARHVPRTASAAPGTRPASVALVVRPGDTGLELLVIRRAEAPGDPWSGHMAFPGGRHSPGDADREATAVRETREEVGVDLATGGSRLGRLDDVKPGSGAPPVLVSAFVFAVPSYTAVRINFEVAAAFWIPLRELTAPGAATEYLYTLRGEPSLRFPALAYGEHRIWGLTHRILAQFLEYIRTLPGHQEARSE